MPWSRFCSTKCRMSAHRKSFKLSPTHEPFRFWSWCFVYAAAWLSNRFDLEVLNFDRAGNAPTNSCKLAMVGDFSRL
jgi:hypothetical protein